MKTHHKGQMTVARSFAPTSAANVGKGASRLVAARLGPIWRAYWLSPPVGPGPISDRRSLLPEPTSAARSHSATGNERAVRTSADRILDELRRERHLVLAGVLILAAVVLAALVLPRARPSPVPVQATSTDRAETYELRWTTEKDDADPANFKTGVVEGAARLTLDECNGAKGAWESKFRSVHEAGRELGIITTAMCKTLSD